MDKTAPVFYDDISAKWFFYDKAGLPVWADSEEHAIALASLMWG